MNRFTVVAMIFCSSLVAPALLLKLMADAWDKKTIVTFNYPVEIPGGKAGFGIRPQHRPDFQRGPNTPLRDYHCDAELPFAADRQNGNNVWGNGSRLGGSHQGVVLSGG